VTKEQLIILGFVAAAFVAGWVVHAVTGRGDGDREQTDASEVERRLGELQGAKYEIDEAIDSYHDRFVALVRGEAAGAAEPSPQWRHADAAEADGEAEAPVRMGPHAAEADRDAGEQAEGEPPAAPIEPRPEPLTSGARKAKSFGPQPNLRPLADEVRAELDRDAANESMLSVLRDADRRRIGELDLDLTDWGFTYGVAWRRARERWPKGDEDQIAREALEAATIVFEEYTDGSGLSDLMRNADNGDGDRARWRRSD
jgi:hypothetical protein